MSQSNQGPTSPSSSHVSTDPYVFPTTPGSVKSMKSEERKSRALSNIMPKLPSSDSLSNTPGIFHQEKIPNDIHD